jgi:diguanylate cyclase (GGDEF)-like protein
LEASPPRAAPSLADAAAGLGLSEDELTPSVRTALHALLTTIDELRGDVAQLKGQLADLRGLADHDTLTPLLNRRAFVRELSRVRAFCERYGGAASLIYFDLDGFKAINDRFGHAAGDVALKAVAERLIGSLRESDVAARLGGDEFAVILVQADRAVAQAKAASLAAAIEDEPVDLGEWSTPLRLSYGVEEIGAGADAEDVLASADQAMYVAKRARKARA